MVHGGSRGGSLRARVRAHYMCAMFFEKQVFRPDGRGLKGGAWRKTRKRRTGLCPNGAGIMALFISGIKGGEKKRYLTFKKVRLTFWKVKLTFLKVSRTLKTGVFKALIVHFRNCFPCRGIHKGHGYLKEKSRQNRAEWNISRGRKVYFGVFQQPLRFIWYGMYEQVRWRGVKEQVKDDHSPLK